MVPTAYSLPEQLGPAISVTGPPSNGGGVDEMPIRLVAEPVAAGVRILVIGSCEARYKASFSLQVWGNSNRTVHHGSANLEGGKSVVLSSATFGVVSGGLWRARLEVQPEGGRTYEQVVTS